MTLRTAAAASAALAALATVCACTSASTDPATRGDADGPTTTQTSQTLPDADGPIDLAQIPDGTALEPGTYSVGLLHYDGSTRAIVDLPDGYSSDFGGSVIGSDGADVAFWGAVTRVDTDPCLGGRRVAAGVSVHDLAALLVAQRHMTASQPLPVTIGGYHGVYLELTAPADLDPCRGKSVTVYGAGGDWLRLDAPNAIFDEWILNVRGQRVVAGARISPDAAHRGEIVGIVETAQFTAAD
jgi:hypothetical protein